MFERDDCAAIRKDLEKRVYSCFKSLKIPSEPTVYDYLLISLRKKDLIATFNWDDLLLQARKCVSVITNDIPALYFLHGNVDVGYCPNCEDKF